MVRGGQLHPSSTMLLGLQMSRLRHDPTRCCYLSAWPLSKTAPPFAGCTVQPGRLHNNTIELRK